MNYKVTELLKIYNFCLFLFFYPRSFSTTTHSLVTSEHMDSFGINSIKSYDTYLDIQTTSNQKHLNYKVVDIKKYYNFGIKFVFIEHHMRKL